MARSKANAHKFLWLAAGVLLLSGCTTRTSGPPAEQVKQQAAVDATQVRHDLKAAGREAKKAILQARVETKAAVAGAREGWKAGAPRTNGSGEVDINHASLSDLETLPGIGGREARRIVADRPYSDAHALESRGILSHSQYDRISAQITAQ
jgi:DNA uptake protein ComE-like DNA-binding protein